MYNLTTVGLAALLSAPGELASVTTSAPTIDEIVVSVTRRDTSASDVGAALSVVDGETVVQSQLITDALADAPGIFLQQTTPGQGALIIRGLRGSSLLHLVDGMRLNNAIFRNAPTQYLALVPTTAVEQIETIRGTPTSLYGSDAVGGAVQIVSRLPEFDESAMTVGGNAYAGINSAEALRTIRATLDAGTATIAGTLSAEYTKTGDRRTGDGERIGPSGYTSKAARAALRITPDDSQSWTFDFHYLEQPSTPRVDELVPGFGQTTPDSDEFYFEPNRRIYFHARHDHWDGPLDLDWRVGFSWQRVDDDRRTRNFESDDRRLESSRSDLAGVLLTAGREFERGSWVAGVEFYHDEVTSQRIEVDITNGGVSPATPRFPDGSTLEQAALFFNANRSLTSTDTLTGGLRLSSVSTDLAATVVSVATKVNTTDISGDLGWQKELSDQWQVVANLGAGFRAPNVFDLGTLGNRPGNRFNIPNTNLESERIVQADLGVRLRHDKGRFEAFVFALDYDDRITSVSTGDVTPDGREIVQSVNVGKSEIWGVEAAAIADIGDSLRIEANARYTRGEQNFAGSSESADRIPPLTGRISLQHATTNALTTHAWVRFADRQDRLSARDIRDPRIDPSGTAGWGTVGGRVDWTVNDSSTVSIGVDNLLDRRYRKHGSGLDAPGRNFFVTVSLQW